MALNKGFYGFLKILRIRSFDCDFSAVYGFESDSAGVKSEAIETQSAAAFAKASAATVEFVADNWVVKSFEVHPNLMSPACLRFGFDKSNASIFRSFQHLEIRDGFTFFPSRPALGGPFFKIRNTSAYRQIDSATVIFKIATYKKVVDFFNLSFLKLFFEHFVPYFSLSEEKYPRSFSIYSMHYSRSFYITHRLSNIFRFWIFTHEPLTYTIRTCPVPSSLWYGVHYQSSRLIEHDNII